MQLKGSKEIDTHLPDYDDEKLDTALRIRWRGFRATVNRLFMQQIFFAAASPDFGAMSTNGENTLLLVEQQLSPVHGQWYGTWEASRLAPPTYHFPAEDLGPGRLPAPQAADVQAKSESRLAIIAITFPSDSSALALDISKAVTGKLWDGFVLDMTSTSADVENADMLRGIASLIK